MSGAGRVPPGGVRGWTAGEAAEVIEREGGRAVLTDPDLPTGSDRIHAAISALDPGQAHDAVINVQGDVPMLDPAAIGVALAALADPETDIATLAAEITAHT